MTTANTPNIHQQVSHLQTHYTTVQVIFIDDYCIAELRQSKLPELLKEQQNHKHHAYTYKADSSLNVQVGDLVVVHANSELKIVQVVAVDPSPRLDPTASYQYKWVVDKIDLQTFFQRLDEQDKLAELLHQLYHHEQQQNLIERLNKASQSDDEVAKLWQQLKTQL